MSFELEPDGPLVKLTVVHDDFDEGSTVAEMVSGGWPRVVGEIKTLLEAGGSDAEGLRRAAHGGPPVADVLAALTTLDGLAGWWTPDVSGSPAPGGALTFRFGGRATVMRVEHVDPAGLVVWTCPRARASPSGWAPASGSTCGRVPAAAPCSRSATSGSPPSCRASRRASPRWEHHLANLVRERVGGVS